MLASVVLCYFVGSATCQSNETESTAATSATPPTASSTPKPKQTNKLSINKKVTNISNPTEEDSSASEVRRKKLNLLFYGPDRPCFCQKEKNNNIDSQIEQFL